MSELRIDRLDERLSRLEDRLERVEAATARIELSLTRIEATLPHLATKADLADLRTEVLTQLADKPSRLYMWGVMAALTGAYTAALAAIGVLLSYLPRK